MLTDDTRSKSIDVRSYIISIVLRISQKKKIICEMVDAIATVSKAGTSTSSVASSGPAAPRRLEKTTACLPFVYGSVAFYLGKKADDFQTHQWTLYVRGPNNEDLSLVISKVIFQLHPSFAQPIRELTAPPFEVTERGWGEFEAQIRIIWKDPFEKATVVCYRTNAACGTFVGLPL
jgi:hypothetical protein